MKRLFRILLAVVVLLVQHHPGRGINGFDRFKGHGTKTHPQLIIRDHGGGDRAPMVVAVVVMGSILVRLLLIVQHPAAGR